MRDRSRDHLSEICTRSSMNMGPSGPERSGTREREKDRLVLLMLGRDDLLLSGTSIRSAVPSDIDTSTWRNRASLRVRYNGRSGILKLLPPSHGPRARGLQGF